MKKERQDQELFTFGALLNILALWWILEAVDHFLLKGWLDQWGIVPLSLKGLIGIPLSPFLHGDFGHLMANSFSFLALGYLVLRAEQRRFYTTSLIIVLVGGFGTWLIGSKGIHIGASGLIYGYFGYVMARGLSERRLKWIGLALLVGVCFGGMIWGVLPAQKGGISWEGHLCGMLVGAWIGRGRALQSR